MVDGVTSAERRTIRTAERRERETIIERRGPTETDSDQREVGARFVFCADDQNRDRRRARAAARAEKSRPRRRRRRARDPGHPEIPDARGPEPASAAKCVHASNEAGFAWQTRTIRVNGG